jgi:hypothetical protein
MFQVMKLLAPHFEKTEKKIKIPKVKVPIVKVPKV